LCSFSCLVILIILFNYLCDFFDRFEC
jgi:hypothetical protein